jgi:hypothetical protein
MRNFHRKLCSMQFGIEKGSNFQNLRDSHGFERKNIVYVLYTVKTAIEILSKKV